MKIYSVIKSVDCIVYALFLFQNLDECNSVEI